MDRAVLSLALGLAAFAPGTYAQDTIISANVRNPTNDVSLGVENGFTQVDPGVTYWLSGRGTHNWYGNVENFGSIIISQTDSSTTPSGQTVDWSGTDGLNGNLVNHDGASIQLNDVAATSAPTYDWYLNSFENDGTLQMCGRGDTGGSTFQLYCNQDCHNTGLISFEQTLGLLGASFNWRNDVLTPRGTAPSANIYNDGAFRMINVDFQLVQNVLGAGCWQIGTGATFYLQDGLGAYQNPNDAPALSGQSIIFNGVAGTLHMDTQVYSHNSAFGAVVYGFGTGHAIEFYETIATYAYVASGTLTVTFVSGNIVNIEIGVGYNAALFSRGTNRKNYGSYNAIFYAGVAPTIAAPPLCSLSATICSNLQTAATITSGIAGILTSTTTKPGSGTDPGTVIIET